MKKLEMKCGLDATGSD